MKCSLIAYEFYLFCSFYRKIDYEKGGRGWNKMMRASPDDWTRNLETIVQWSPYSNEEDLLQQVINPLHFLSRYILYYFIFIWLVSLHVLTVYEREIQFRVLLFVIDVRTIFISNKGVLFYIV